MAAMERWVEAYYPSDVQDLMNKLLNMIDAADKLDANENEEEGDAMEQTIRSASARVWMNVDGLMKSTWRRTGMIL